MYNGHFTSADASIDHGDAGVLFPVDELDATVSQYRDAELVLADVDGEDVIVVSPTGVASGYFLTQHPLTAISVESLPTTIRAQLNNALDTSIGTFEVIQVGKWNRSRANHSLTEFSDA